MAVFNSEGLEASDDRTRVRLGVQVVARKNGTVETGFETLGEHRGFELLDGDPARIAEQAAGKALTLLGADPAPAGEMTVVVGGGFGGVLFHEMTGHGLEADAVQKGASVYAGRLGEKVAQPLLTAYDDGVMPHEWGTGAIDDEGTPCQQDRGDRGGQAHLLPLRPPARPTRRRRVDRQRAARELPRPADPPDDQHLHRAGRRRSAGDHRRGREGLLRGLLRRRPGRARHRRLRLRRLRGLPDRGRQGDQALPRRHPDRQLPAGARADRRGRQRLRDEDGLLRQGGPDARRSAPARATSGSRG